MRSPSGDSQEDLRGNGDEGEAPAQRLLHVQAVKALHEGVGDEEDEDEVENRDGVIGRR
jgi:hypothetical protein